MSVWLAVRMFGGAWVATLGALKLLPTETNAGSSRRRRQAIVAGGAEIGVSLLWVVNGWWYVSVVSAVGVGAGLTLIGVRRVRRTGSCGCGGPEATSGRAVVARNSAIFGCIALGCGLGPEAHALVHSPALQREASALPLLLVTAALSVGVYRQHRPSRRRLVAKSGDAPLPASW